MVFTAYYQFNSTCLCTQQHEAYEPGLSREITQTTNYMRYFRSKSFKSWSAKYCSIDPVFLPAFAPFQSSSPALSATLLLLGLPSDTTITSLTSNKHLLGCLMVWTTYVIHKNWFQVLYRFQDVKIRLGSKTANADLSPVCVEQWRSNHSTYRRYTILLLTLYLLCTSLWRFDS